MLLYGQTEDEIRTELKQRGVCIEDINIFFSLISEMRKKEESFNGTVCDYAMNFPIIKVRDKGSEHTEDIIVGADRRHHYLKLTDDGNLMFFNIQCCDGTGSDGSYEFIVSPEDGFVDFGSVWDIINLFGKSIGVTQSSYKYQFIEAALNLKSVCNKIYTDTEKKRKEIVEKAFEIFAKE